MKTLISRPPLSAMQFQRRNSSKGQMIRAVAMTRIAPFLPAVALFCASIIVSGCATLQNTTASRFFEENGPVLSVRGRISVRQVAKPLLLGTYEWNRGPGFAGWTESFVLRDANGIRLFQMDSDERGTVVQYQDRVRRVESMRWLVEDQLGMDVEPKMLANWFENNHVDGELPDKAKHEGIYIEVHERHGDGKPAKIRLIQDETIILMTVTREFA